MNNPFDGMAARVTGGSPHLRPSPAAAIVNACSVAATAGLPNRALKCATKGAVLALTLAMRLRAPDAVPAG